MLCPDRGPTAVVLRRLPTAQPNWSSCFLFRRGLRFFRLPFFRMLRGVILLFCGLRFFLILPFRVQRFLLFQLFLGSGRDCGRPTTRASLTGPRMSVSPF